MNEAPFTPGITITSATVGATQTLALGLGAGASGTPQVMLSLLGAAIAFYKFGNSAVTAVVTDTPIMPNSQVIVTPPAGTTHIAVVGTAGVLYATTGHGV